MLLYTSSPTTEIYTLSLHDALPILVLWVMRKQSAEMAESHEIRENIRKVQIIDVRETPEFDAKHILGARSIPDRKSTRLNSSHVSISYAVFCLKKKKTIQHTIYYLQ